MKPFYVELGYQVIIIIIIIIKTIIIIRVAIRYWRSENSPFTVQNSPTNVRQFMTLYLSPATRILNENPE